MKKIVTLLAFVSLIVIPNLWADVYKIDPSHSTVSFKIRHLFSNVQGLFKTYEGSFIYDPQHPETWKAEAILQAASIDTGVADRDKHLKNPDFFDVEKYPTLEFKSSDVVEASSNHAKLNGILKMHGIEKPITLDVDIHGVAKDPWGNTRIGVTATTTLNRKDFGLVWNKTVETGQLLVGEEVQINLEIEGILQSPEATEEAPKP